MIKPLFLIILIVPFLIGCVVPPSTGSKAIQYITIPDEKFEQALVELHMDNALDGRLLLEKAIGIDTLNLYNKGITSLDGIESFTNLTVLNIGSNSLENLNVSQNKKLMHLSCPGNSLTHLDVKQNRSLKSLYCSSNLIFELDLSQNKELTSLSVHSNKLSNLNLQSNLVLSFLDCEHNNLTTLDLSCLNPLNDWTKL